MRDILPYPAALREQENTVRWCAALHIDLGDLFCAGSCKLRDGASVHLAQFRVVLYHRCIRASAKDHTGPAGTRLPVRAIVKCVQSGNKVREALRGRAAAVDGPQLLDQPTRQCIHESAVASACP